MNEPIGHRWEEEAYGLGQGFLGDETSSGSTSVLREVEAAAIGTSDALHPAVASEALGVPTVARIVGHLILHVLAEPTAVGLHTHHVQEEEDAGHKVGQRLVCDDAL